MQKLLLIADAKTTNKRLEIVVEYSSYVVAMNFEGWRKPREVDQLEHVRQRRQIRVPVVSRATDGEELWRGDPNDRLGNLVEKGRKYRAQIRFIGDRTKEQVFRFGLLRTSMTEKPYIVEVFTEVDLQMAADDVYLRR